MTSTKVMGNGANFMDALVPVSSTNKSENGDFKSFLNLSNNSSNLETISQPVKTVERKNEVNNENIKTDEPVRPVAEKEKADSAEVKTESREVETDDVDQVKEAISEIISTIKEKLNVSDDDIVRSLEELGLTPVALLNPEVFQQFIAAVTQTDDPIMFATNEELLGALNNIEEEVKDIVEDICKALDIDVEKFTEAIEKYQAVEPEADVTTENEIEEDTDVLLQDNKETLAKNTENPLNFITQKIQLPEDETNKISSDENRENKVEKPLHNFSVHNNVAEETETKPVTASSQSSDNSLFDERNERPADNILSFAENLVKETVTALNENSEAVSFTTVDAARIINQITESIKTEISAQTTEINMKLHPESLGNVNVRITANNEGVLTARFIAENESVKSVIEAQTISLKETLESKGVTVEAVEVMVASHKFDESFNRERGNAEANAKSKKGIRRINLNGDNLSVEEENDDEASKLAMDIMRQNGNSIDYTA